MTTSQQFKIFEILEPSVGKEKATQFTEQIEQVIDAKFQNQKDILATKDDLYRATDKIETKLWTMFITLVVMILGLYATIIFKK
jgi:hypothetical protein